MKATPTIPPVDASFQHLQLEMSRVDILLHRQIQRQQQEAGEINNMLQRYHLSDAQAYALLQRPFGYGSPALNEEADRPYHDALLQIEQQIASFVTEAEAQGTELRLHRLAGLLGLNRFALDALLLSMAPALDVRYGKLYGFLQDDLTQRHPSINLILDLLCPSGPQRLLHLAYFNETSPLLQYRLVERIAESGVSRPRLINDAICADDTIVTWLLSGQYRPPAHLKHHLVLHANPQPQIALLTPAIQKAIARLSQENAMLAFYGPDDLCQQQAALLLAAAQQRPLLTLSLDTVQQIEANPADAINLALRDARLINAVPCLNGWESSFVEGIPASALLAQVSHHPGTIILCSRARWQPQQLDRARRLYWTQFPLPDYAQRQRLLRHFLYDEASAQDAVAPDIDLDGLAGQFILTTGQLRDMIHTARDIAAQRDEAVSPEEATQNGRFLQNAHLFAAARAHSNPRLSNLARKLTPRYAWQDLVLPRDQITLLREMVDTVRSRSLVLEQWGVGGKLAASAGVTALFFGQPGTGKTMAAEVIAGELGLDLYKIDLSSLVSKYIGETEKNLERIFSEAESSNAILFFDEADAIFGKRSEVKDAHDRYANIEISYLLQRMESYNGVTILSTNLRANLDDAFTRRLQFAVDFPFPKAPDRLRIWQTLFPPNVPRDPNLDLGLLADRFEIAGGNIRNIIVNASYLAATNGQVVTMEHIMHGTRRELQKMGRLVNERDLTI
ncbi:MAG: ATP-binding protein [Anaerolineales bacterium]|nr:ATP-binding protein [Anaerolineales bacterium]